MTERQYWRSIGRCTECHKEDAYTMNGRSLCADCAEKDRQKKREQYGLDPRKYLDRNKESYDRRKELRLCVKCGKPLESDNPRVRCLRCTRKLAMYEHKVTEKNRPPEQNFPRGDNGICYICNRNPVIPGKSTCADCYPDARDRMLNARAKRDTRQHSWNSSMNI